MNKGKISSALVNPVHHLAIMRWAIHPSLFLISAATLTFEITLTRYFSVTQFYHFAFMIVSIALLGFGASGSVLVVLPRLGRSNPQRSLGMLGFGAGVSILGAYLLTNGLPFDSFSIAWDRRQIGILFLHYSALALPFFFSGMAVGLLLETFSQRAGQIYATNLLGSALGCLLALIGPSWIEGEGMVMLSSGLGALGAILSLGRRRWRGKPFPITQGGSLLLAGILLGMVGIDLGLRLSGQPGIKFLEMNLSPYKSLSYALQYPDAKVIYRHWNAFSRVDIVRSANIHTIPGLSYRYLEPLPQVDGLSVDGDDLSPIIPLNSASLPSPPAEQSMFEYLPAALAYHLRPQAEILILEPRGGLDIAMALAFNVAGVTAVEVNPLIVDASTEVYQDRRVKVLVESERAFLRRSGDYFDIIVHSLAASYHPVNSGAYSLVEDYRYTVEAFQDAIGRLKPGGLLLMTRWLQNPPSEELRAFTLAITALERSGADPKEQIIAFRGYNTMTIMVKNGAYTQDELNILRDFAAERAFDLVYTSDLQVDETNRYNILPEPIYSRVFLEFIHTQMRQDFYRHYPFDVRPPTDDHPFFGHYFKWSQAGQIIAGLGKTWQPFGGAGYFVILVLFLLALIAAGMLIFLPLIIWQRGFQLKNHLFSIQPMLYFMLIGLAYLLVEIPLIQRFILYLGHPSYAMTIVLFTLLFFSGFGSRFVDRIFHTQALLGTVMLLLVLSATLPPILNWTLGLSLSARLVLSVIVLAPLGFLMGIPFPSGLRWATETIRDTGATNKDATRIPWLWAVNGASSVLASILAALMALSYGFNTVLWLGAFCYAGAWLAVMAPGLVRRSRSPRL